MTDDIQSTKQNDLDPKTHRGPSIYWLPESFPLEDYNGSSDPTLEERVIEHVRTHLESGENQIGKSPDNVILIATPGPVLIGAVGEYFSGVPMFIPAETTLNWVSLGIDHRLSDVWATWQKGRQLSRAQVQGIVDTCRLNRAERLANYLEFSAGDTSEPDGVTRSYYDYGPGHESAVVTLRTARARAVAQGREMVTTQDLILGMMAPGHRDGISIALRRLADPEALQALDKAGWSRTLDPGPARGVEHAIRDILGSAAGLEVEGVRNASLLHTLLVHGFDRDRTFATMFPKIGKPAEFVRQVLDEGHKQTREGFTGGYTEFEFLQMAGEARPFEKPQPLGTPIPVDSLFPPNEIMAALRPDALLIPATQVDVPEGTDKLEIEHEAAALARLIAYKKTTLPLSIGIFGHWGSGKTFFLNMVKDKIGKFGGHDYHKKIVTIEFNAWHYMETNIWASLVSVIFQGLLGAQKSPNEKEDTLKILDALSAVQDDQIDAVEGLVGQYRATAKAQDDLVKTVDQAKADGPDTLAIARAIFNAVKKNQESEIKTLKKALADEAAFQTVGKKKSRRAQLAGIEYTENIFELLDASAELIASGRLLKMKSREVIFSPWLLFISTAVLLGAPFAFYYAAEFMGGYHYLSSNIAPILATLTTAAGAAAVWIRKINGAVNQAYDSLKEAVDSNEKTKEYKALLDQKEVNVAEALDRLNEQSEKVEEIKKRVRAETFLGRLNDLIQARAEGDTYTKHLGIIATIRKDFENLSKLLSKTNERDQEEEVWQVMQKKAKDRLETLEKDAEDLINKGVSEIARANRLKVEATMRDRGVPDAPAEVPKRLRDALELVDYGKLTKKLIDETKAKIANYTPANNIDRVVLMIDDLDRCPPEKVYDVLQAVHLFLSFPLFVAMVGVDTRWMETSLKQQLGDLVSGKNGAAPRDYLEKIFQIPYWTKELQPDQARAFVGKLLEDIDDRISVSNARPGGQPGENPPPIDPGNQVDENTDLVLDDDGGPPLPPPVNPANKPAPVSNFASPTKDEADFMAAAGRFAGTTPRGVIRFLNIFLLIKTLPEGQPSIDKQRATITQLALCVGTPEFAGAYFDELERADRSQPVSLFGDNLAARARQESYPEKIVERIGRLFELYAEQSNFSSVDDLIDTADIARKFTFASPEAISLENTGDDDPPAATKKVEGRSS